jgi:RHS repeat-associated protein
MLAEYSTIVESQSTAKASYLTSDHLGSPRVVTDGSGAVVSRKDFAAYGDEVVTPQRTVGLGYQPTNIREDYTGYQRDEESGLEFAEARFYNPLHGRFTSVDPLNESGNTADPQTFNRYAYAVNDRSM